jgi:hypothetical protein
MVTAFYVRRPTKGVSEEVICAVKDHETWTLRLKRRRATHIYVGLGYQDSIIPYILFGVFILRPALGC